MDVTSLVVLGALVGCVIGVLVRRAARVAEQNLKLLLPNLEQQLNSFQSLPPSQQSLQQPNLAQMLSTMNLQFQRLNSIQQGRHDLYVGRLNSIAARAGIRR